MSRDPASRKMVKEAGMQIKAGNEKSAGDHDDPISAARYETAEADEGKAGGGAGGILDFFSVLWSRVGDLPFWAREVVRKSLHIGVVILALPIRWTGWWYGLVFAAAAMAWNGYGMPRYFRFTFRDEENQVGYSRGMLSYPVMVFILIIFFPLPIAASQWATLSFGDGFATLIGRFWGKRSLPWNRDKTYAGVLAFLVMGSLGSIFFFWFSLPNAGASSWLWAGSPLLAHVQAISFARVILICVLSTAAAAFFESVPIPHIDDNIAAPFAGAVTKLALCFLV